MKYLRNWLNFHAYLPFVFFVSCHLATANSVEEDPYNFTPADIAFLNAFSLSALPSPPPAPSNRYADDEDVAKFGRLIFFDERLSKNKKISCATCHQPEKYFTDGLPRGVAIGESHRSTPTVLGSAWSPWQYWDGRKDSLWSQALEPIENPKEMGIDRALYVKKLLRYYREDYEAIFGKITNSRLLIKRAKSASPTGNKKQQKRWNNLSLESQNQINRVFTNAGKALMAYQRQLTMEPSRFDLFIDALASDKPADAYLNATEVKGLRLFMGKANCASCHNGPLMTNYEFHNIGAPEPDETAVDLGRFTGVAELSEDEFTCLSQWSDAGPDDCNEMKFLKRQGPELVGAFKTPTLRNIQETAPYMQSGQFKSLVEVINHYNVPKPPFYDRQQHPNRPHFDILPLKLTEDESDAIVQFLATLTSPYPEEDFWWTPPKGKKN